MSLIVNLGTFLNDKCIINYLFEAGLNSAKQTITTYVAAQLWVKCSRIWTWKQLKCDPLQSQIPWLWSLVMLQWFAEVRLRCEQVGFTEWGFREGNRYWIYRNPMEALPQSAHPPEILASHSTAFMSHDAIASRQPMQCSVSNIIRKHTGVIHQHFPQVVYWHPELVH